jgi:hypothetical protein
MPIKKSRICFMCNQFKLLHVCVVVKESSASDIYKFDTQIHYFMCDTRVYKVIISLQYDGMYLYTIVLL